MVRVAKDKCKGVLMRSEQFSVAHGAGEVLSTAEVVRISPRKGEDFFGGMRSTPSPPSREASTGARPRRWFPIPSSVNCSNRCLYLRGKCTARLRSTDNGVIVSPDASARPTFSRGLMGMSGTSMLRQR